VVDPVQHIARGIHRLSPIPPRSPMLIKHRPSHLAQGPVLPFHNTILGGVYGLENWCSRPKSWQKVSKREFLIRAIITGDSSYGISVPLIPQPQD
jgi:hypothetical protein